MQPGHNGGYNEHRDSHGRFAAGLRVPHPDAKEVFREGTVRILHPPARADGSYHAELWNGDALISETRLTRAHRTEMAALKQQAGELAAVPAPAAPAAVPAQQAVVAWKPAMTPAEADAWAKDSVIKETMFHVVRSRDSWRMAAIEQKGFTAEHEGSHGIALWGNGIYLAYGGVMGSRGTYEAWMEKGDTYQVRVNINRPFTIKVGGDDAPDMKKWLPQVLKAQFQERVDAAYAKQRLQAGPRPGPNFSFNSRTPNEVFKQILAEQGYDALIIDGSGIRTGGHQLLVFDPKNVTITGKAPFVYQRSDDEDDYLL